MNFTTPAPTPQATTIGLLHSGPSPHCLPRASAAPCGEALGVEPGPDAADMPDACPCCGQRLPSALPAAWTPGTSAVLDWITLVEDDLHNLKRALAEVLP